MWFFFSSGADGARIIRGKDAAAHSRPFMASVQVLGQHICGGVLVREDFVLTAAHCDLALWVFDFVRQPFVFTDCSAFVLTIQQET